MKAGHLLRELTRAVPSFICVFWKAHFSFDKTYQEISYIGFNWNIYFQKIECGFQNTHQIIWDVHLAENGSWVGDINYWKIPCICKCFRYNRILMKNMKRYHLISTNITCSLTRGKNFHYALPPPPVALIPIFSTLSEYSCISTIFFSHWYSIYYYLNVCWTVLMIFNDHFIWIHSLSIFRA